jgi:SAM-dependent methyltransferase
VSGPVPAGGSDGDHHGGATEGERFWEGHYRGRDQVFSGHANPVLVGVAGLLRPGAALDLGCGEGGDAIWLARHGWRVTAVDVAATALERAAEHARTAGVADRITFERHDLTRRPVAADPHRWQALVVIAAATLMVVLDASIVNLALPQAQADLGIRDADRHWVLTAYTLAFGGLLLLGGRIADSPDAGGSSWSAWSGSRPPPRWAVLRRRLHCCSRPEVCRGRSLPCWPPLRSR